MFRKLCKKIAILLILLLKINSLAAVVSDNDGSAFITKAEFDSLKNDFQAQINSYNTSIDSKIDGAIAAYLAGIKVSKETTDTFYDGEGEETLICNTDEIDNLKWGKPYLHYTMAAIYFQSVNIAAGSQAHYQMEMKRLDTTNASGVVTAKADVRDYEIFYYEYNKKEKINQMLYYADDLEYKITINSLSESNGSWGGTPEPNNSPAIRWHGCGASYEGDAGKCIRQESKNRQRHEYYSDIVGQPNYVACYGTKFNLGFMDNRSGGGDNYQYKVQTEEVEATKIKTVFDIGAKQNQLFTPKDAEGQNFVNPTNIFARNEKIGDVDFAPKYARDKTYQYNTPTLAGIVTTGKGYAWWDRTGTNNRKVLGDCTWTRTGSYDATDTTVRCRNWVEPYFNNTKFYASDILNASATKSLREKYKPYGWTGAISEGIPISEFKQSESATFDLVATASMTIAFDTEPFEVGKTLQQHTKDKNLKITVTHKGKTEEVKEGYWDLAIGKHTVKVEYQGDGKKAIFFKAGLHIADMGEKKRRRLFLPKEFKRSSSD